MKKIYLVLIIVAIVTIGWYLFLFSWINDMGTTCECHPITENTYQGPDWPELIPSGGCGDCGRPNPPSEFFSQLLVILLPAIIIFSVYGAYEGIRKLVSRNR